jgi:hypothetical protein
MVLKEEARGGANAARPANRVALGAANRLGGGARPTADASAPPQGKTKQNGVPYSGNTAFRLVAR